MEYSESDKQHEKDSRETKEIKQDKKASKANKATKANKVTKATKANTARRLISHRKSEKHGQTTRRISSGWFVAAVNLIFIAVLALFLYRYDVQNKENIRQKNLENISNLNASSVQLAEKYLENQARILANTALYLNRHPMDLAGTMEYLDDSNAEQINAYEIVDDTYQGYDAGEDNAEDNDAEDNNAEDNSPEEKIAGEDHATTDSENAITRNYQALDYTSSDYKEFHTVITETLTEETGCVVFVPEFTDAKSAKKSLGMAAKIPVMIDGTLTWQILLLVEKAADFADLIQLNGGYDSLETAMIDNEGNYISSSASYKSDNFFRFLYLYNNLTKDEQNIITQAVQSREQGTLYYKNADEEDSVYVYKKMYIGDWYIVSGGPLSIFRRDENSYLPTIVSVLTLCAILFLDIFWLHLMNVQLRKSMVAEKQANSAKSDFLARMSHDIRTPLNAVIGFSRLASEEHGLSDTTADYLTKINSSGQYLLSLINDILDMSKIENNKLELHETLVDGRRFLKDIAAVFVAQAREKGITMETDFTHAQTPWVYMDEVHTRQIYSNLLNNAIKFSGAGSTIRWKIIDEQLDADRMRMVCTIADEGCGMSEVFMQHLFQPFEQEQNEHSMREGGTGLGLSIVKNLVELMGGTIEVQSQIDVGSTFTITLTRQLGEAKDYQKTQDTKLEMAGKLTGKRALLCEDHPLNREIAVKLLSKQGMLVTCAEDGAQGVRVFEHSAVGDYQVILMDIRMPVMNGLEATRRIRALQRPDAAKIPIIAMTANAYEEDVNNCLDAGMNAHIAKPLDPAVMIRTIGAWMEK